MVYFKIADGKILNYKSDNELVCAMKGYILRCKFCHKLIEVQSQGRGFWFRKNSFHFIDKESWVQLLLY